MAQEINGKWSDQSLLKSLLGTFDQEKFKKELASHLPKTFKGKIEDVWVTIAFLLLLASIFRDKESEWAMIAIKAKKFL